MAFFYKQYITELNIGGKPTTENPNNDDELDEEPQPEGENDNELDEVNNDINMNGMVIPPIGTDTYPFIGEFNGNNYTISNFILQPKQLSQDQLWHIYQLYPQPFHNEDSKAHI